MIQEHDGVPSERWGVFVCVDPIWPRNWAENGAGVRPIPCQGHFEATKADFSLFCLPVAMGRLGFINRFPKIRPILNQLIRQ
jgi:hypothetical protein